MQAVSALMAPVLGFRREGSPHYSSQLAVCFNRAGPLTLTHRHITICGVRVGGVEIPDNKRIEFSLQHIYGIGRSISKHILYDLNIMNKITKDLSEEEIIAIRNEVSKYMIEGDLRRFNAMAIQELKEIECYRGLRHIQGLPCRGQRTKNNCRTLKGKRITVPGKKKPPR